MTTFRDLVRERFPSVTDDEADFILWEHTGFPSFFQGDAVTACRSQLTALATLGPLDDTEREPVIKTVQLDKRRPRPYPQRRLISTAPL